MNETTELGISVYPDLRPWKKLKSILSWLPDTEFPRVFSSMFSVEGTKEEVLEYFRKLIAEAHKNHLKVSLDVNPMCFEKMGAFSEDLKCILREIEVDNAAN